ncbi:MAG TPA: anti-sigma factor [Tepidisphaeraceae bacterium]|nr:anti-sigma factor [Tepidisphaeraceae bacterium]
MTHENDNLTPPTPRDPADAADRELALMRLAGRLGPDGRADLARVLSPAATAAVAAADEALAGLATALPPVAPPAHLKAELFASLDAEPAAPLAIRQPPGAKRWLRYAAALIVGTALGAAAWQLGVARPAQLGQARRIDDYERLVRSGQVSLIEFAGQPTQPKAGGRVFWDKERGRWHVYVFDLAPPAPGREYELWFITGDQRKIPAGAFTVDAGGRASLVVAVPDTGGPIALAAVTDEPAGVAHLQPTGQIHLVGQVK